MKLFIINRAGQKVYLNIYATVRQQLRNYFGSNNFICCGEEYNIDEVWAEAGHVGTPMGVVLGGLIGILAGPIGVGIGIGIGGGVGFNVDSGERRKAGIFNMSR